MPGSERIVSLLSSATEILFALGLDKNVAAVSHECNFPADALQKPKATFTRLDTNRASADIDDEVKTLAAAGQPLYGVDREMLKQLRPDLIITQTQCDVCAVSYEEVASIVADEPLLSETRVVTLNPQRLADVFSDIQRIGAETDRWAEAAALLDSLQQRVEKVKSAKARGIAAHPPRVACIEWIEPLMIAANWVPELVVLAGGLHGMTQAGHHTGYTSWAELAAYDPDVVIVAPCGFDLQRTTEETKRLDRVPEWNALRAVRTERVFAIDGDAYLNRSGPRLVDSVEMLAGLLQDDLETTRSRFPGAWCPL
jgi:iron complex transport system substrate-binding protein